jgi:ribosomal protein L11 methyltransferase
VSESPALELRWPATPENSDLPDLLYASLDDFKLLAIDAQAAEAEGTVETWRVFFRSAASRDDARREIERGFAAVQGFAVISIDVPDEAWARRSQAEIKAIRVGRVVVAPPWDQPESAEITILIEPSTGFGTGHHETTRLCLAALQQIDLSGQRVIDVGTGSGVLAIAAASLGATPVVAVDNDPEALRNARENLVLNRCGEAIDVVESELSDLSLAAADVVVANLTAPVLVRHAAELHRLRRAGGVLIASGFGEDDEQEVAAALAPLRVRQRQREGAWSAMVFDVADEPAASV